MQPQSENGGGAASELRSDARHLGETAANRVHSALDERKGTAASQARSVSTAFERAGSELDDAPQWLKSAFSQGAQQIQRFADTLEQKDSRQILNEVQNFARERPGAFLATCAAAGFAAARLFKAGGEAASSSSTESFGQQQGQYGSARAPAVETGESGPAFQPISRGEFV